LTLKSRVIVVIPRLIEGFASGFPENSRLIAKGMTIEKLAEFAGVSVELLRVKILVYPKVFRLSPFSACICVHFGFAQYRHLRLRD